MRPATLAALIALAVTLPARAAPLDRVVHLEVGESGHIEPFGALGRVFVANPSVVHAEVTRSGEVVLDAKAEGTTRVFFHGRTWIRVWRVTVGDAKPPGDPAAARAAAKKACPDLKTGGGTVTVTLSSAGCAKALLGLDPFLTTKGVELAYSGEGLMAQVRMLNAALAKARPDLAGALSLAYLGATLRIEGHVASIADLDAAERILWSASAAPLIMDLDGVTLESDGGTVPVTGVEIHAGAQDTGGGPPDAGVPDAGPRTIEIIHGFDEKHPPK